MRSRISPSKPGAKTGITTGARRTKRAVIDAQHHRHQQQQGRGEAEGLSVVLLAEQFGEDRDEGRLQGGVGEQGADQVGDLEGDREGRHRPADPVVAGGDDFAAEAGDARGGGGDREERGRAGDPARLAARRRARRRVPRPGRRPPPRAAATSASIAARSSGSGVSGALGVSKLRLSRYSRRPPGAGTAPARALDMANIASQKKRILRSERERAENRLLTSTVKTHFRRLESAVEGGDAEAIATEQRDAGLEDRQGRAEGRPAQEHRRPQEGQSRAHGSAGAKAAAAAPAAALLNASERQLLAVVGAAAAPELESARVSVASAQLSRSAPWRRLTSCLAA